MNRAEEETPVEGPANLEPSWTSPGSLGEMESLKPEKEQWPKNQGRPRKQLENVAVNQKNDLAMSTSKKRKVDTERRVFNKKWTSKYFFTEVGKKAFCLICKESLAVFKEYNLNRHFETKHASKYDKLSAQEKTKKAEEMVAAMQKEQSFSPKALEVRDGIMRTSYEIAHIIAKKSKPFSEGEFVKECILKSAAILCPDKKEQFENVRLSRRTIVRRVEDISENLHQQLKSKVNDFSYFALALDDSCDVKGTDQLLIFIRGITENFELTEELALIQSMKDTTTGKDLLEAVDQCVSKLGMDWKKLVCVTTYGSPNLAGKDIGLLKIIQDQVKETDPEQKIILLHCIIHQEVLCKSVLKLSTVVDTVTKVVSYIRARGLNHRQFAALLEGSESEHTDVLHDTSVSWLSLGNILKRVWELRAEIGLFLNMKEDLAFPQLNDADWLSDFAFAIDVTGYMNDLNSRLQEKGLFAHELHSNIKSFMMKLLLFARQIGNKDFSHFPTLQQVTVSDQNLKKYVSLLVDLHAEFSCRFKDFQMIEKDLSLVSSPFTFNVDSAPCDLQLELIDLQYDALLAEQFQAVPLPSFYASLNEQKFPKIKTHARKMLVLFGSTYVCEQTRSVMKVNKSNLRSSMSGDHLAAVLRIATTEMTPDFDFLVNAHQRLHSSP
ncbi:general transcription factor II-I repeat domain-containing protein 2-like [Alligator sinensis]|uniref:General transcription factor II-I repeat domain-containing protein 2-like n=1 Tax=Alligator sinensis TaxID=38654 RepID=A0A1U7S4E3_ALLSI|nr:general transcription factor II-I repeat domain-containing protein 2-like [Alligator sinensis]